ncbi:ADP-ribosylglycohydrolase family protein [Methylobacterium organophilum]|uniref:ADP-ribosylglycohydrolase family protein n=1 Tax=Methylobacterium organophilum TaxID=410 RepID=UPI001F13FD50|nr:ADP-ribosylglycohydrolase family protein [Methylobacterium organophilum]UMY18679.1 ADP-ribosylglycohydrolase family protein [Methylobacterium organophilum]
MDKQLDRARGAMVGLAVGDALGAPIEFSQRDSLPPVTGYRAGGPHRLKAGQFTDDGTQALCLADSLVESEGVFDPADFLTRVAASYRTGHNYVTGRCFDIGNQTVAAIEAFETAGSCRNNVDEDAQGNGALMRLVPAVLVARTELDAVVVATAQSQTTHASPVCIAAAQEMASILWEAIEGRRITFDGLKGFPREQVISSGHAPASLHAAKWAIANTETFEDAVLLAVNLGDDSDTVGAITGQLAGAIYGYTTIPQPWCTGLAWHTRFASLASSLFLLRG